MPGYVINSDERVFRPISRTKQGWDGPAAIFHELEYSFGGTQYRVKIIAETFEVARDMVLEAHKGIKDFNLDCQMVGNSQTTIHDVSPGMRKALIKAWSKPEKKTSLSERLFRSKS